MNEVFRANGQQKVSMRKAYEMTRAVNQGLEQCCIPRSFVWGFPE